MYRGAIAKHGNWVIVLSFMIKLEAWASLGYAGSIAKLDQEEEHHQT